MSETIDTSRTAIDWPFGGKTRRFQLRLGEISELERLSRAGIGEIMLRLAGHRFYAADVWETIRLGLEGGGMHDALATALVERYHTRPIADYLDLAGKILSAAVTGVEAAEPGKEEAATSPETSPPSTDPGEWPA
ncbi:gene transfer agent family protein [Enterovirga rhinocerotis]|uniref:Tail tube GTA-gp10-like protein n=1 Tax=Enterovirga rhinocerotis TaxID=1339210 RepID=A0A4R7CA20_9HYPH|nr:gene transfer agent family protein [Enterovirga rhinocerotis]TDR94205.1 tail tube GTA-gp10-like protein [Enterovirga rhinocerotis]